MTLKFLSLASGSSGNCYYLGTDSYGILFDAGISARAIKKALKDHNIAMEQIMAVFITHDHTDHVASVGSLGEKYNIPIYATAAVHKGIIANRNVAVKPAQSRRIIGKDQPLDICDFTVTAFEVPHDATDCVGYSVDFEDCKWVLATDVGHISDTVAQYIRAANYLVIEANYDNEMLESGRYPAFLKKRIRNGNGHLSNTETAQFIAANFDRRLKNIWLCHLSRDNNHPELACKAVELSLREYGVCTDKDVSLTALKRNSPTEMFVLKN